MFDWTPGSIFKTLLIGGAFVLAALFYLSIVAFILFRLWISATEARLLGFIGNFVALAFVISLPLSAWREWIGWVALGSGIYSFIRVLGLMFTDGDDEWGGRDGARLTLMIISGLIVGGAVVGLFTLLALTKVGGAVIAAVGLITGVAGIAPLVLQHKSKS